MASASWDQLEELFGRARELSGERRSAFLAELRAADERLVEELESLLEMAEEADGFFDDLAGALGAAAAERATAEADRGPLVGERVRRFEVTEKIGAGGMGVVYRARDTRLGRTVALKFLPPHLGPDEAAKERFLVEARAAAALDHPNICTVYEVGETEEGRLYLAMACYEGETLKERLKRGPLSAAEAYGIAAQIARGLAEAHSRGIVHRDVKPGNVMLTPGGVVKLLDFGLAKLPDVTLTGPNRTPGTVAYMSPEQVRGERVDARTDLWSLGVVLYEMLVGERPFAGEDQRAVLHAILEREPKPLGEQRPDAPATLLKVTERALSKRADERPQSAAEVLSELGEDEPGGMVAPRGPPVRTRRRRRLAAALLVGVVGVTAGYIGWTRISEAERAGGSAGSTGSVERGRVVVADFESQGPDTLLAEALTEVLRIGLAQSSAVTVASQWEIARALNRMRREGSGPLTLELAREVALREGIDVVVGGRVQQTGSGYVIAARLVDAESGEVVRGWVETPADSTEVSAAIGRLAAAIRETAGESLASGDGWGQRPTWWFRRVTTLSLPAFQKYVQAKRLLEEGNARRSAELFEEAIALDTAFAAAYLGLGVALASTYTSRGRELEVKSRAFRLRHQLTEIERYHIAARYHRLRGALRQSLDAFRNLKEATGGQIGHTGIGLCLLQAGRLAAAEAAFREGWATLFTTWNWNVEMLIRVVHRRGRVSEARGLLRGAQERYPERRWLEELRIEMTTAAGDYPEADSLARHLPLGGSTGLAERHPLRHRAVISAIRGRYREALQFLAELAELQLANDMDFPALNSAIYAARLHMARGDTSSATAHMERFLERVPIDSLHPFGKPWVQLPLADFFVEAGRPDRARSFLQAYDRTIRAEFAQAGRARRHLVRAKLASAVGDGGRSLEELSRALRELRVHGQFDYDLPILMPVHDRPEVARIYASAGRPDSAIAVYERYLANTTIRRVFVDAYELAAALERLAGLYETVGRPREAADMYRRLAELWSGSDPHLQPRIAGALRRAEQLSRTSS